MIVCPNCNHQNPEGALQCENCSTPLPATTNCPNCGASVQTDATFCGQCGFNLQVEAIPAASGIEETIMGLSDSVTEPLPQQAEIPTAATSSPINSPWDEEEESPTTGQPASTEVTSWMNEPTDIMQGDSQTSESSSPWQPLTMEDSEAMPWNISVPNIAESEEFLPVNDIEVEPPPVETPVVLNDIEVAPPPVETPVVLNDIEVEPELAIPEASEVKFSHPATAMPVPEKSVNSPPASSATRLQTQTAQLFHVQTDTNLEIPLNLAVIHIGKPNTQIPPDIDVSGFPNSEVVSRIHADIRVEGDAYFIEDVGSSNGTYVNHSPLLSGNRHRLRTGDRIALGKGDLVSFIFQIT